MFYPKSLDADYIIFSYPKAGRTWLRSVMGKYYHYKYDVEDTIRIESMQHPQIPKIMFNHMVSELKFVKIKPYLRPFSHIGKIMFFLFMKAMLRFSYSKKTMGFVVRDPRDTIVSFFNRHRYRNKIYHKDISHFIRDNIFGIHTMIKYYNYIRDFHTKYDSVLITYEDMKKDTPKAVSLVLQHFGEKKVDQKILKKAIDQCSFDRMKKNELKTKNNININENSLHIRKGKVGGYKEELSNTDINYINDMIDKHLKIPFYKTSK